MSLLDSWRNRLRIVGHRTCWQCEGHQVVAYGDIVDPFGWCPTCGGSGDLPIYGRAR